MDVSVMTAFTIDISATFIVQISYILMKLAHMDAEKNPEKSIYFSCKWISGFACILVGNIVHVAVMPFCPLVLLATNDATAILMSAILAVWFLNERIVWRYYILAFMLILSGTVAMVIITKEKET